VIGVVTMSLPRGAAFILGADDRRYLAMKCAQRRGARVRFDPEGGRARRVRQTAIAVLSPAAD
jgi:hypothetical protein